MVIRALLAGVAVALGALPSEAAACLASPYFRAIIHDALPTPLPANTYIAKVRMERGPRDALFEGGWKAQVVQVVQGPSDHAQILLKTKYWTSCSYPFSNGTEGYIVGRLRGFEGGMLVVDPIEVQRKEGHRLPDGWVLSNR